MEEVELEDGGCLEGMPILHQPILHRTSMEDVKMEDGWSLDGNFHLTSLHLTSYQYGRGRNERWLATRGEYPFYITPSYIV